MTINIDAMRAQAEQHAQALGPGGEKAWLAGLLTAAVPGLLAEIQRLTDSEDSRVVVLEAENKRLKADAERARPVLDAARAFRAATLSGERYDLAEHIGAIARAVDAAGPGGCAGHTRKPSEPVKLPVCADCGHRHRWGGECADHSWTDACPYDADANCEAGHTKAVAEKPTGGISEKTMSALVNYARATGMIPSEAAAEGLSSTDTTAVERD